MAARSDCLQARHRRSRRASWCFPSATSARAEDGYFCEGLTEEIINVLTRIAGLRVIPARPRSRRSRGLAATSPRIGRGSG